MKEVFERYMKALSEQTFALWVFQKNRGKSIENLLTKILPTISETTDRHIDPESSEGPLLDFTKRRTLRIYSGQTVRSTRLAGEVAGSEKWLPHKHGNLNLTPAPHEKPDMVTLTYNPSTRWRQVVTKNSRKSVANQSSLTENSTPLQESISTEVDSIPKDDTEGII